MIAHKLHSFLVHNSSSVLLSPKVHALFVPWKNMPEVTMPPPTSAFTFELITLVRAAHRREENYKNVVLTCTSGNPPSRRPS